MPSNESFPHVGDDGPKIKVQEITPQELARLKEMDYYLICGDGVERILINDDGATKLAPFRVIR